MKRTTLALLMLLAACASGGTKVDPSQMAQFQRGKTTQTDVVTSLGDPTTTENRDDGTTVLSYMYTSTKARPESFIPIAGAFIGGADTKNSTATFTFNKKHVLTNMSNSQGAMGLNSGRQ